MVDDGRREIAASQPRESQRKVDVPAFVDHAPRAALLVFVVISAVSFFLTIRWGTHRSLFVDDWDFIQGRDVGNLASLLRAHNEHWTTVPILAYRAVWSLFGIHTYLPYKLLSISAHLATAGLLRAVMRRSGVAPWIATAAAGIYALFGAGAVNIFASFQITFVGAVMFGLIQLLLADHDGPTRWRDGLALVAGLASLMCSGVGVTMVFIVGLAVLLQHGWRRALVQTVPLALIFLTWWLTYGHMGNLPSGPREIVMFVVSGLIGIFDAVGYVPGVGVLLALVIPAGIVITWSSSGWNGLRRYFGTPLALAFGSLLFLLTTGYARAVFGAESAQASRYLDLGAAMWLPLIAVAATAVARRWWVAGVVMLSILVVSMGGNTKRLSEFDLVEADLRFYVDLVRAMAHSDLLKGVPDTVRPFPEFASELSTGWLAEGARSGRIPAPATISKATQETLRFRLSFSQGTQEEVGESCVALTTPIDRDLNVGDRLIFTGVAVTIAEREGDLSSRGIRFMINYPYQHGNTIDVLAPVKVRVFPVLPGSMLCR